MDELELGNLNRKFCSGEPSLLATPITLGTLTTPVLRFIIFIHKIRNP